jgi:hypothetical protein
VILRTGAPWADLPDRYPSYQTCHRRFQQWVRLGVLRSILEVLAQALHDEGYLDLQEAFIDGSFAPAKHDLRPLATLRLDDASASLGKESFDFPPPLVATQRATVLRPLCPGPPVWRDQFHATARQFRVQPIRLDRRCRR